MVQEADRGDSLLRDAVQEDRREGLAGAPGEPPQCTSGADVHHDVVAIVVLEDVEHLDDVRVLHVEQHLHDAPEGGLLAVQLRRCSGGTEAVRLTDGLASERLERLGVVDLGHRAKTSCTQYAAEVVEVADGARLYYADDAHGFAGLLAGRHPRDLRRGPQLAWRPRLLIHSKAATEVHGQSHRDHCRGPHVWLRLLLLHGRWQFGRHSVCGPGLAHPQVAARQHPRGGDKAQDIPLQYIEAPLKNLKP
mmetsp:Transcript_63984/g.138544  ORF Transcript_63984/g.138544 Transcript_63984/m.138544 type:complete len:249 (+) Transcript_63984:1773-2519(+)